MSGKLTTLNLKIDSELKQDFKECAVKNQENMTDVVIRAIKKYVKEDK